jgi:hypothetical protein
MAVVYLIKEWNYRSQTSMISSNTATLDGAGVFNAGTSADFDIVTAPKQRYRNRWWTHPLPEHSLLKKYISCGKIPIAATNVNVRVSLEDTI